MEENYKYVRFPLPLIQSLYSSFPCGFDVFLRVGIYIFSQDLHVDPMNAQKQALYCYYRKGLTDSLQKQFDVLLKKGYISVETEYTRFKKEEFVPEVDLYGLSKALKGDQALYEEIIEFHRIRQALSFLKIDLKPDFIIKTYNCFFDLYGGFVKQPYVSMKTDLLLEYSEKQPGESDIMLFTAFAGIKSIIGNSAYAGTTREMIICRMFGASNQQALAEVLKDEYTKTVYDKYSKRYHFEKLLDELVARGFIQSKIGWNRRTYVSCKLDYTQLADSIKKAYDEKGMRSKIRSNKEKEAEAKMQLALHLLR
ncbi:MAG: hypothetical protein PHI48_00230 [Bacteroidales bacterium]|nr:hypothetical protein [Bacteroidales bacterium]MDD4820973.1 hypothetical protein [Bacteroidales bacterium]